MLATSIFSFTHDVICISKTDIIISATFEFTSATAFNLDPFQFLSSGKELRIIGEHRPLKSVTNEAIRGCYDLEFKRIASLS